jgi:hypothetical protein
MKHFGSLMGVVAAALLVGCGPEVSEEALEAEMAAGDESALISSATPEPDEQMLQALAASCQPTNTNSCVNAGYSSCAAWSDYYDCGELSACTFGVCRRCEIDPDLGRICYPAPGQQQGRNRYRVCFNAAGQSCTEYELLTQRICTNCGEF